MDDDDAAASASPSPSPSPVASALPVADPVTVAAGPPSGLLALALPIQKQQHAASPNPGGGGGGREDAWSEGATAALIDAWGERFVALGRGSLRHPQWQEVADAVSSREGYAKAPKSDVQCKNRIDTLKKKYKIERAKPASSWQFFGRLDDLLAPTFNQKPSGNGGGGVGASVNGRNPVPAALRVGFPQRSRTPLMPAPVSAVKRRALSPEPSASSESSDGFPPEREPAFPPLPLPPPPNGKRSRADEGRGGGAGGGGDRAQGLRELAQAIRRFGEAYERVETAKLEQSAEMERRRLDFASELESQRVQFFLNTQMELSQVKNHSSSPANAAAPPGATGGAGGTSRRMASVNDASASGNYHRRYRVSDGGRHRHHPQPPPSRPHYQYHENNIAVAAAAAASDGEQSDDEEDDDEEESQ
uniref:Myb/SANT-like DNA-binding domain-containing protein n=1 Tax=Oryza glumipatula TaxID=40148 RepID=A0A0D9ZLB6_9ORYZ